MKYTYKVDCVCEKIGPERIFGNPTLVFVSSNFEHDLALTNAMPGCPLDFSPVGNSN